MNQKKPYKSDAPAPEYLHEVKVDRNGRNYTLKAGMLVSVTRRTNLPPGRYVFKYAEYDNAGMVLVVARGGVYKWIRQSDIAAVHVRTGDRE